MLGLKTSSFFFYRDFNKLQGKRSSQGGEAERPLTASALQYPERAIKKKSGRPEKTPVM
jgi:hypothetical protein